jgi:hypothetical protein
MGRGFEELVGGGVFWKNYTVKLQQEQVAADGTSVHTRSTRRHIPEDGILLKIELIIIPKLSR